MEALCLVLPWTPTYALLLLSNFDLYLFPVVNCATGKRLTVSSVSLLNELFSLRVDLGWCQK